MSTNTLRPFRKENIPAYGTVMIIYVLITVLGAFAAFKGYEAKVAFPRILVFSAIQVMLGMCIMFGASLLNLRKMRPGFERLARGEKNPDIPPVWCPVLSSATQAVMEFANSTSGNQVKRTNSN